HNWTEFWIFPDLLAKSDTARFTHSHIRKHHIEMFGPKQIQSFLHTRYCAALQTNLPQKFGHELTTHRVIIYDEHPILLTDQAHDFLHRRRRLRVLEVTRRKVEPELSPLSHRAGDLQLAAQQPHDPLADMQPEADPAAGLVIVAGLVKRLKNIREIASRNSLACISHFKPDSVAAAGHKQRDFSFVCELDRVADEIVENLPEPHRIG